MNKLKNELIFNKLKEKFSEGIINGTPNYDIYTITVEPADIKEIIFFLYHDNELKFQFLTTMCGLHYPEQKGKELGVMYQLHCLENNTRLRLKTFFPIEKPEIDSITSVFKTANWMEREAYDFFGIVFKEHPNLKRILNVETMTGFPLRKEFPLEENTRKDKEDVMFGRERN